MNPTELLEKLSENFGLRKVADPEGHMYWKDDKSTPEGWRETLYFSDVQIIKRQLGLGAIILDLDEVDYTRGALQESKLQKALWLKDGRKITISMETGSIFAGISNVPDPDLPPAIFMDQTPPQKQIIRKTGTQKCIHPECEKLVDLSKRKSGACCKAHMSFECTHPDCITRAEVNQWSKPTHPFGTKIAAAHWPHRKQEQ